MQKESIILKIDMDEWRIILKYLEEGRDFTDRVFCDGKVELIYNRDIPAADDLKTTQPAGKRESAEEKIKGDKVEGTSKTSDKKHKSYDEDTSDSPSGHGRDAYRFT